MRWQRMLKTFKQLSLALELLKRHARISIVHKETGIPKALLRNTYRDLHGRSSRPGALKYSTQGLTRTIKKYKGVTRFALKKSPPKAEKTTFGRSSTLLIYTKSHILPVNSIFRLLGWSQGINNWVLLILSNATIVEQQF